jgi:hypothetical protein
LKTHQVVDEAGFLQWLPFLNAFRTMCMAPDQNFRGVLEQVRSFGIAA